MKYTGILIFIAVLFTACSSDQTSPFFHVDSKSGINLRNIQVGDQSKYILYNSQCDGNFEFTGDTLVVEITEQNDSLFLQETYTKESSRERTTSHAIFPKDGYVLIPQRSGSEFLFFYGNDTIFLDRPGTVQLIQSGCQLLENADPFIGDAIGFVEQFQFGEMLITNKKGISCVPRSFEVDAYIFYADHLNAVHIIQQGLGGGSIIGFMAIE